MQTLRKHRNCMINLFNSLLALFFILFLRSGYFPLQVSPKDLKGLAMLNALLGIFLFQNSMSFIQTILFYFQNSRLIGNNRVHFHFFLHNLISFEIIRISSHFLIRFIQFFRVINAFQGIFMPFQPSVSFHHVLKSV